MNPKGALAFFVGAGVVFACVLILLLWDAWQTWWASR